jgi:hypothetical protein
MLIHPLLFYFEGGAPPQSRGAPSSSVGGLILESDPMLSMSFSRKIFLESVEMRDLTLPTKR